MPLALVFFRSSCYNEFTEKTLRNFTYRWIPMYKKISIFLLILCFFPFYGHPQEVRKAVYAGQFYDGNPQRLSASIETFFDRIEKKAVSGKILALISPHAGYMYSGHVAAHSYSLIRGRKYDTVVVIGTSHHHLFEGCSVYPRGGYETPLGVAWIDDSLAAQIKKKSGFGFIPAAHDREHSIEVQIPFIQKALPEAKIIPIIMGRPTRQTISNLANSLYRCLQGKNALLIASTDLSHFYSKAKANQVDNRTISLIQDFDTNALIRKCERGENIMCGGGPVVAALLYSQKFENPEIETLLYADSSNAGGPDDRVVGYLSAVLYSTLDLPSFSLNYKEKAELLQIARSAVDLFVKENKRLDIQPQNPSLLTKKGVFVTLKKQGYLRGCVGFFEPIFPLYEAVIQAAIYAASKDVRFPPVAPGELGKIKIEISILSPFKKIDNPRLVEVGKHGLMISQGANKGLLLPQVPVENHWSRTTFLQMACQKAGLPDNAWKTGADVFIFEAEVFH
jgi:AmmeMemoRadiSam system protein B/AmmeMemoRadiSam system protein A